MTHALKVIWSMFPFGPVFLAKMKIISVFLLFRTEQIQEALTVEVTSMKSISLAEIR